MIACKVFGTICIALAILMIVIVRVSNLDMAEGRMFVEFLPVWILAIGFAAGGCVLWSVE